MFSSTLALADKYDLRAERFAKAYAFLRRDDLATLEPGRHEIDGDDVFANIQAVTTKPASEKTYEAHRRYFDIHYVISGTELIGVADVSRTAPLGEFDEAKDFGRYGDPESCAWVTLEEGDLLVCAPEDAHKPCCTAGDPAPLVKVCVKIAVD